MVLPIVSASFRVFDVEALLLLSSEEIKFEELAFVSFGLFEFKVLVSSAGLGLRLGS